ncbi:MAG: phosphoenolpyruvate--protein phosphotransferase, partial [Chloroflexi bacterium]|nr:phosphoenolpyruvate--protein phosphotransferase [Chloroflexota bacterium]
RLIRLLTGWRPPSLSSLTRASIIVASDLKPSDTAQLDPKQVLGLATAAGSATSHTAILARGLGLPAVVGLGETVVDLAEGTNMILDGFTGQLLVDPDPNMLSEYRVRQAASEQRRAAALAGVGEPAVTRDGHRVEVAANIGDEAGARLAVVNGAEAVGLLRTEFLYLDRSNPPSEDEQVAAYTAIANALEGRPLIIRTLDIGGDKPALYLDLPEELNPFLGWRAIRFCLARPDVFKTQLRAILRAAQGRNIKVMFPMIATLDEIRQAKALLTEAGAELTAQGTPHATRIETGIMVEVPAAAVAADLLAPEVNFFSLGTNDLVQYTLAADRTNPRVAPLADPFNPAVLRLIKQVIDAGHAVGKWVGMCGEMAGMPQAIPILLGLGLDEFSMTPAAIPEAKALIRRLSFTEARDLATRELSLHSATEMRNVKHET